MTGYRQRYRTLIISCNTLELSRTVNLTARPRVSYSFKYRYVQVILNSIRDGILWHILLFYGVLLTLNTFLTNFIHKVLSHNQQKYVLVFLNHS